MKEPPQRMRKRTRRTHDERRCSDRPRPETHWTVFARHPREWIFIYIGTSSARSEDGRICWHGYPPADGKDSRKHQRYFGGRGLEPASRSEDDGFFEGHQ